MFINSRIENFHLILQQRLFALINHSGARRLAVALLLCLCTIGAAFAATGNLDPTFGATGTATASVALWDEASGSVLQPDGKFIVAGHGNTITVGQNIDFTLVRYNPDGSLDASFGTNGRVSTDISFGDDRSSDVALQADGKIVVVGYNTVGFIVVRYNQNGTLDNTFDGDGKVTTQVGDTGSQATGVLIQPDGKIVVTGNATVSQTANVAAVRYNPDGSLDQTFGTGGMALTALANGGAGASALQAEGKILLGGFVFVGSFTNFAAIRYNPDGTLDSSFNGNGKVVTAVGDGSCGVYAIMVQTDGKIVASGYANMISPFNYAMARYNSDGSLDTSFGTGGKVITRIRVTSSIGAVRQQPDGKLIAAGSSQGSPNYFDFCVARYESNGTLDTSFGVNGIVITALSIDLDKIIDCALQPDGKIIVGGVSEPHFAVARYNPNGTLDSGFGFVGRTSTNLNNDLDEARAVAVQPDGKIVAGGSSRGSGGLDFALTRYTADGFLDNSFGIRGKVITPVSNSDDGINGVALQADGKILAAGYTASSPARNILVARYNANGSLDTTFDGDGIVSLTVGLGSSAQGIAVQPDGKIVIAGYSVLPADMLQKPHFLVARFNSDGSPDTTFDSDGIATTLINNISSTANALALQSDGKLVLAGAIIGGAVSHFALARYNPDGSLDTGFGTGGTLVTAIAVTSGYDEAHAVAVQPDGKLVAAGFSNSSAATNEDFALVRYNPNGSLDSTFDGDGIVTTAFGGNSEDEAAALVLQRGGKVVVVGGTVTGSNSNFNIALARYNANGSLDKSFGSNGRVITDWGNFGEAVYAAALQTDGKIVMAGGSNNGTRREFTTLRYAALNSPLFDFDGDGKTDLSVFRPSTGSWYSLQSTAGFRAAQFGASGDRLAPGDYDGDGKTDTVVFRPANGYWYFLDSSTGAFRAVQFGASEDIPATGDFDNDGKSDICVYRPSNNHFYLLYSTDNSFHYQQWGTNGDVPVVGDYDGDGKSDFAIFRPNGGAFYVLRSSDGAVVGQQFGQSGDQPIAGDFDGDGRTDMVVFRPANNGWYILQSSDNGFRGVAWGTSGDVPSAGDYDGDGKWDVAIFRPSSGSFYILQSATNALRADQFGTNGDVPVPSAYVP